MDFYDVEFLSSRVSVSTIFPKNCGSSVGLWTAICLETWVGGKQGHAPREIHSL